MSFGGRGPGILGQTAATRSRVLSRAVAWWQVSQYSGSGNLLDLSGNGHHLTLNGSPAVTTGIGGYITLVAASSQYLETADAADLDFGAGQDFTVVLLARIPDWTITSVVTYAAKKANTGTGAGWSILHGGSANQSVLGIADGSLSSSAVAILAGQSNAIVPLAIRRTGTALHSFLNTTKTAGTDTTGGNLSNAEVLRFGRLSGAGTGYANMDFFGGAVFRLTLADEQIARVATELQR